VSRVVVIGAGAMGLAAAYHALKRGHDVALVEAAGEPGGMAAHFDFSGLSIERFYHFVCKSDQATFDLLTELGLSDKLRWVPTSMGYYFDGALYPWGDPISLLQFPHLSLVEKFRYGMMMFTSSNRRDWRPLENLSAKNWIESWCGKSVYDRLWRPLFDLKFYEYADNISAAWLWTRIKRVGTSRRSMFQEELGHIDGGSQTLVNALVSAIKGRGGRIVLFAPASEIICRDGAVTGVSVSGTYFPGDAVIATVPTPFISALVPALTPQERKAYDAIANIGVVCVVFRLKRSVSPHFWVNISDRRFEIPGIVEFSNLRPVGDTVVYVPYYMPTTNKKFTYDDRFFCDEAFGYLKHINPHLKDDDLIAVHVGRLRHAQPVCPAGFAATVPPIQTSIAGLQIADTCFYYPEDRGISESVRIGRLMAEHIA
jgi:protoporphyrinogen oxidase